MSEINTTPETKPQPDKGQQVTPTTNPYLDEAERLFPIYEAQRRREIDTLSDLQRRVTRLETLLTTHGINLNDM